MMSKGGLNIAYLNVASILGAHKFDMMKTQVEASNLDIFCASETWLTKGVPDGLVAIKGFNIARLDRKWKSSISDAEPKKGGGLICYSREKLVMNEFRYEKLNRSNKDIEMQWISLEMPRMRNLVLVNIYRPPQGSYKTACKSIHEAIREADLKDNAELFVLGDFNIDMMDKISPMTRELSFTMSTWGLKTCISEFTRMGVVDGTVKQSCIDNIFTNSEAIAEARVGDWNLGFFYQRFL